MYPWWSFPGGHKQFLHGCLCSVSVNDMLPWKYQESSQYTTSIQQLKITMKSRESNSYIDRMGSNLWLSCLSLPLAEITDMLRAVLRQNENPSSQRGVDQEQSTSLTSSQSHHSLHAITNFILETSYLMQLLIKFHFSWRPIFLQTSFAFCFWWVKIHWSSLQRRPFITQALGMFSLQHWILQSSKTFSLWIQSLWK